MLWLKVSNTPPHGLLPCEAFWSSTFIVGNGYSYASIELLVVIFRPVIPVIKLVWLLTFFLYLCKWGSLWLTGLCLWIGRLIVALGDRPYLIIWCYVFVEQYVMYYYMGVCPEFYSGYYVWWLELGTLWYLYYFLWLLLFQLLLYCCVGW